MDKIRVLLAGDHVIVREGTGQLVQREPDIEIVGEASDGEEASSWLRSCAGFIFGIKAGLASLA